MMLFCLLQCVAHLTKFQKLMVKDVKVNRPLMRACRESIRENKCFRRAGQVSEYFPAQQSLIIICLEEAIDENPSECCTRFSHP